MEKNIHVQKVIDDSILQGTLNILNDFSYIEDGIDFKKAITIETAYCYAMNRGEHYNILKYLVRLFFPITEVHFCDVFQPKRVLFTYEVNRKDYVELIQAIRLSVPVSDIFSLSDLFKRKFTFPKPYYLRVFKAGLKCKTSIKKKLYLSFKLLDLVVAYRTLKSKCKTSIFENYLYVPLNSSRSFENIITQYLNIKGCHTFHLCHGLHFSPNYRFWSIDAFNKELIVAKTVLSWGQGFVDNDIKFYHHNYHHEIVGNPKYPFKNINISFKTSSCIVFLARKQYDSNNLRLLSVLNDYANNTKTIIYIKPHPTDNMEILRRKCAEYNFILIENNMTVMELLSSFSYGFAIAYETTAYFEAMYFNLLCFRYSFEENESYGELDNRFTSYIDLQNQVEKYSSMDLEILNSKITDCLKYEIGMGINRYAEVLR